MDTIHEGWAEAKVQQRQQKQLIHSVEGFLLIQGD